MPIYEYYCPDNHTIYQFYAKTLAQGKRVPKCPANPKFKLRKLVSAFAVTTGGKSDEPALPQSVAEAGDPAEDVRMEAAMGAMEKELMAILTKEQQAQFKQEIQRKKKERVG